MNYLSEIEKLKIENLRLKEANERLVRENFSFKKEEERLNLLEAIFSVSNEYICVKDGDGKWLIANGHMLSIFGLDENYVGKTDKYFGQQNPNMEMAFNECVLSDELAWNAKTTTSNYERIDIGDASSHLFHVVKTPIFNQDGSRQRLIIVGNDVSELKYHELFRNSIQAVYPDMFFVLNREGIFLDFHTTEDEGLFTSPDVFLGKNIKSVMPESVAKLHFDAVEKVFESKDKRTFEYTLNSTGKDQYYVANMVRMDFDSVLVIVHDITTLKNTQLELELFKETHLEILDSIEEGVLIMDEKYEFLYVNKSAEEMYGYSVGELDGQSPSILSRKWTENLVENINVIQQCYEGKSQLFEFYGIHKKGHEFPVEVSISAVNYYGKGAIISVSRDVSSRKKFENDLKSARDKALESDRLKSSFLAILSHELRTPLNAVIGFSEIMKTSFEDKDVVKLSEVIHGRGLDLLCILEDTLQMALIESGQLQVRKEKIVLADFFENIDAVFSTLVKDYNKEKIVVKCTCNLMFDKVSIDVDKTKLTQIFVNLVKNAIKFTEEGEVTFGVEAITDDYIRFFVADTGMGIAPKDYQIIFQSFRQANENANRNHGGLGLGLPICKALLTEMGGSIDFKSEQGIGTRFIFQLPLH